LEKELTTSTTSLRVISLINSEADILFSFKTVLTIWFKSDSVSLITFFIIYSLVINIHPNISGGNSFHFFPKIFPEIFYEYVTCGIEPPYRVSKCHIWGGYGGGEGVI
jgi:hypothetical protein